MATNGGTKARLECYLREWENRNEQRLFRRHPRVPHRSQLLHVHSAGV